MLARSKGTVNVSPLGRGVLGQEGDEFFPQRAPGEDLDALIQGGVREAKAATKPVGQHLVPLLEGEAGRLDPGRAHPKHLCLGDRTDVNGGIGAQEAVGLPGRGRRR